MVSLVWDVDDFHQEIFTRLAGIHELPDLTLRD
jgi:hypothetical protein